jgi:hypothetical protein
MRRVTSGVGTFRTSCDVRLMSAFRGRSEVAFAPPDIHNGGFATGRSWRKADLRPNWHVAEGQQQIYPSEHNSVVTLKPQIALLLDSDLADAAPDGMIPAALTGGHDG